MSDYSDHLDAEVERADRRIRETGERVSAHIGRNGPVTGRATSPDGAITIVVGPGGRLLELNIENSALTMQPEQLADILVKLAGRATRNANGRMQQAMRGVVRPEVADSLTHLGISPGDGDEDGGWVDMLGRVR